MMRVGGIEFKWFDGDVNNLCGFAIMVTNMGTDSERKEEGGTKSWDKEINEINSECQIWMEGE